MARKQRSGVVVGDAMDKTVVVSIQRTVTHPLYHKVLRRRKKYQAHDETNLAKLGDRVLIEECRPISKRKRWRVLEILERHEVAEVQPRDIVAPSLTPDESESEPKAVAVEPETVAETQASPETEAEPETEAKAATPDAGAVDPPEEEAE